MHHLNGNGLRLQLINVLFVIFIQKSLIITMYFELLSESGMQSSSKWLCPLLRSCQMNKKGLETEHIMGHSCTRRTVTASVVCAMSETLYHSKISQRML